MEKVYNYLNQIQKTDNNRYKKAKDYIDFLAKPIGSLGELENIASKIYAITNEEKIDVNKRCVIVLSSDNGIFEEGVASTPQEVTAIQSINMLEGKTGVSVISKKFNADVKVCDVGIKKDIFHPKLINKKIRKSTNNFLKEYAMSEDEVFKAINIGIELVKTCKDENYKLIGTGEMGIANTTTSSAVLASILGFRDEKVEEVVGVGAGLSKNDYLKKVNVIKNALKKHNPNQNDVIDILKKVGGFDIASMVGVFIGCAYYKIPVVVDGFISIVSALCAVKLNENIKDYMFLSHISMEKGYKLAQKELGLSAYLDLKMRLGEGSGCAIMFSIIDASVSMFNDMATFDEAKIDPKYLEKIKGD